MTRTISWFSCGAASAVATKLAIAESKTPVEIVYCHVAEEQKAAFTYNNDPVMNVDFGVGTSEDPYLRFNFIPSVPGVLAVKAVDNDGKEFNHQTEVKN